MISKKVSVVMAVYNGEKYLKAAIKSILNQTYRDFEFIIINDGSRDRSLDIINEYLGDERIILINNFENKGLIYSLNKGIDKAKGKYIVRMDCDDISHKTRIEKQVEYMEKNLDVIVSGSGVNVIFEGIPLYRKYIKGENDDETLKINSIFYSSFTHPSVIIRKEYLIENKIKYEEKYKNAEDYRLWTRILANSKCGNIEEPLLSYRIVKKSVTRVANKDMDSIRDVFKRIYKDYLSKFGIELSDYELELHFEICMIQNLDEFKYSINEKEQYIKNLKNKILILGFNKEKVDKIFSQVMCKTYIYQKNDINKIDKELKGQVNFKKIYFTENIKKSIKKFYK